MKNRTLDETRAKVNAMLREKGLASGRPNIVADFDIQQIDERTVRIFVKCTDGTGFTVDFDPLAAVADSDFLSRAEGMRH